MYSKAMIARIGRKIAKATKSGKAVQLEGRVARLSELQIQRSSMKDEARTTHLAHMFVRGTPIAAAENPWKTKRIFTFPDVQVKVEQFTGRDPREVAQELSAWSHDWFEIVRAKIKERNNVATNR